MKFYERYMAGETLAVHDEIYKLGPDAFLPGYLPVVEKVLKETFSRVAANLEIIYRELKTIGYCFKSDPTYNSERPLHPPLPGTDLLLDRLTDATLQFGHVPLSLKFFYSVVGSINFAWDYEANKQIPWEMADPLQIVSLDELVEEITDPDWEEFMEEQLADEPDFPYLELSADAFHKDNISGGPGYAILLTGAKSVDSLMVYEPHNTTFIDYLRICIEHCGFPGLADHSSNSFKLFRDKVRPQLQKM